MYGKLWAAECKRFTQEQYQKLLHELRNRPDFWELVTEMNRNHTLPWISLGYVGAHQVPCRFLTTYLPHVVEQVFRNEFSIDARQNASDGSWTLYPVGGG